MHGCPASIWFTSLFFILSGDPASQWEAESSQPTNRKAHPSCNPRTALNRRSSEASSQSVAVHCVMLLDFNELSDGMTHDWRQNPLKVGYFHLFICDLWNWIFWKSYEFLGNSLGFLWEFIGNSVWNSLGIVNDCQSQLIVYIVKVSWFFTF